MGRQLQALSLVAPGKLGLNKQGGHQLLPPGFAVRADNAVIDSEGRLAARSGYNVVTTTPVSSSIKQLHEYRQTDDDVMLIVSWDGGIGNTETDPAASDISGAVTDADGNWQFQDFNGNVYGAGNNSIIKYAGTATFTALTPGFTPTNILLAAYGRLWTVADDLQTIHYTATLGDDFTDTAGGAGQIDMRNVWTTGTDVVMALAAWNGLFIVLGKRHIVLWTDDAGSQLGIQPVDMRVLDVITGTGCIARDSVQHADSDDLLYLSRNGVQSLQRALQSDRNPSTNLTKYVRASLSSDVLASTAGNIRAVYHPENGFYLLSLPDRGIVYCLDLRNRYQDEDGDLVVPVTTWTMTLHSMVSRNSGLLLLGVSGDIGLYGGLTDDGEQFRFVYRSPWLDLGPELAGRLKILKSISGVFLLHGSVNVVFKYGFDFSSSTSSKAAAVSGGAVAEWGLAEWGLSEWGGATRLALVNVPCSGQGQYIQLGVEVEVTGPFALQQLEPMAKIGRLAGGL